MTLRIGISARLLHDPPPGLGLPQKRLQFLESSMAHWIMAHGAIALMVPFIDEASSLPVNRAPVSDIVDLLEATARGTLDTVVPEWRDEVALTVVLATKGYPVSAPKGSEIRGAEGLDAADLQVFHAGTARVDGRLVANGGRVLNVTALGSTVAEAQKRAYAAVDRIDWPEGFCRRDIGWRAIARETD